MKKLLALILAMAICVSLVACGTESNKTSDSSSGGDVDTTGMADEVTMIVPSDVSTLAPFEGDDGGRKYILNTFYERIGVMNTRGEELTLVLAKSCEKIDSLTYEIVLFEDIYDTDGNHITASDVVFCFDQCLQSASFEALNSVDHVEKIDEFTVHLVLKAETMGVIITVLQAVPIVSQKAYEDSADGMATKPIGTTGYVCTKFTAGSGLTAEYVGTWHDDDSPVCSSFAHNVKTINYTYIAETAQMRIALETGLADICLSLSALDVEEFRTGEYSDQYGVYDTVENKVLRVLYNCSPSSACSDQALRQAISYAIDRESINETVYGGKAWIPNEMASMLLADYNPDWDEENYYDYSTDDALAALAESNYDGTPLRIMAASNADHKSVATLIATYLNAIGVETELMIYEDSQVSSLLTDETSWDLVICARGAEDYMVNDWLRWVPAESLNGRTQNFVDDDVIQQYYNEMANVTTHSQELVDEAHAYVTEMCYGYALVQAPIYIVYNKDIISDITLNYKAYPVANGCIYN